MRCHYEVLGVERTATPDEIKKAYRKLALRLHPDKNPDNVQECTRLFAEAQQGYDVLSDPQERAWYDSHREAILRGYGLNEGNGTDGIDLIKYFSASCYSGLGDNDGGFYSVYAGVFATLAREDKEYLDIVEEHAYPPFGKSTSDYNPTVSEFYGWWKSYSTAKSFSWADKYDPREAPNRDVRRLIEKENKKCREAEKKKHNDAVRQLVDFVRKRDKRVKTYMEMQRIQQIQLDKEKAARDLAKKQEMIKKKQEMVEEFQEQRWTNVEDALDAVTSHIDDEFGADSSEEGGYSDSDIELQGLYCPACNRSFASQDTWHHHEISKKHIEKVEALRIVMEAEESSLASSSVPQSEVEDEPIVNDQQYEGEIPETTNERHDNPLIKTTNDDIENETETDVDTDRNDLGEKELMSDKELSPIKIKKKGKKSKQKKPMFGHEIEIEEMEKDGKVDEMVPSIDPLAATLPHVPEASIDNNTNAVIAPKLKGKKAKDARKAARAEQAEKTAGDEQLVDHDLQCHVCKAVFPTRNKVFAHIKKTGHAELKTVTTTHHSSKQVDSDDDWDMGPGKKSKGRKRK